MFWAVVYAAIAAPLLAAVAAAAWLWKEARALGTFPPPAVCSDSLILISGCDTGIGRATAKRLALRGFYVLAGVLHESSIDSVQADVPGSITAIQFDVTQRDSIERARERVRAIIQDSPSKKLVGLVNNAGIAVYGPMEFITTEQMRLQLEINTIGHTSTASVFTPLLRDSKGRMVNVVSIAGRVPAELMGPYDASKFAMEAVTACQRMELSDFGISVSAIEPGFIKTPLVEGAAVNFDAVWDTFPAEAKALYAQHYKAGSVSTAYAYKAAGSPEQVAAAIEDALVSATPRTRYLVGRDAQFYALLVWLLPDRWLDVVSLRLRAWAAGKANHAAA